MEYLSASKVASQLVKWRNCNAGPVIRGRYENNNNNNNNNNLRWSVYLVIVRHVGNRHSTLN